MAHAVVIQVEIDPNSDIEHRHAILNDFVIPEAKALPGFQKGTWMNDGLEPVHVSSCSTPKTTPSRQSPR